MTTSISLLPKHLIADDVRLTQGVLQCAITVTPAGRGQEEIGYTYDKEEQVESSLAHQHGPTIYELDAASPAIDEVLKLADAQFKVDTSLKHKYAGNLWSKSTVEGVDWEGQSSILVGRCEGSVVGICCVRMYFVSSPESPHVKFLHFGIGPFFVPPNHRGHAHAIEMSIAVGHLSSELIQALYLQLPKFGSMGVVVECDFSDHTSPELHPFAEQIYEKAVLTQEALQVGLLDPKDPKLQTISFHRPRLQR